MKSNPVNIVFAALLGLMILLHQKYPVSFGYYVLLALIYVGIQAYGSAVLAAQFFVPVKWKGEDRGSVALTFDDGPVPGKTDSILDILASYKVPAAFFCIGHKVASNQMLVGKMHQAGHLLCNHSYWHRYTFDLQSASAIGKELDDTSTVIQNLIGKRPIFFRPPYGVTNPMVARALRQRDYTIVGWSIRSLDTVASDGSDLLNRITKNLKGGDIILLHDHGKVTCEILPLLLNHISTVGLKIVRLDELLNEKAYA